MGLLDQFKAYIDANTPRNTRPAVSPQNVIYAGLLQQPIENIKANAAGLLGEMQRAPQDLAALASPQMYAKALKAMNTPQPVDKQKWIDAGMELSGMAPLGGLMAHTVYHGSPHKFDKFDMSKIGTGEGAQAYGHGLYFAESPGVAKSYQASTSKPEYLVNGDVYKADTQGVIRRVSDGKVADSDAVYNAMRALYGSKVDQPAQTLAEEAESFLQTRSGITNKQIQDAKDLILNGNVKLLDRGNLYKVDIPDEAIPRMLDWEKTLDQQNPEVQAALSKLGINSPWEVVSDTGHALPATYKTAEEANQILAKIGAGTVRQRPGTWRGDSAYKFISDAGPESAALRLKEAGIPGIRYLDGSSRTAGQGTSNFVLFDDQLPRILEVNGQPTGLMSYADEAARKPKPKKAK